MNASGLSAFDRASQRAAERLYPGRVRIRGAVYDCALVYGPIEVKLAGEEGGGSVWEQGMYFDITKDKLPARLIPGTVVKDEDSGEYFEVSSCDGDGAQDTSWLVTCRANQE